MLNPPGIIQRLCNGLNGRCCPHGESVRDPNGNRESPDCFEDDGRAKSGCVCATGATGEACTCIAPTDHASGRIVTVTHASQSLVQNIVKVDFSPSAFVVTKVRVIPKTPNVLTSTIGCTPVSLSLVFAQIQAGQVPACTMGIDNDYRGVREPFPTWTCLSDLNNQASGITFMTAEENPRCLVEAYTELFAPCGQENHTNPYAGRIFANEIYRRPGTYFEEQLLEYAPYGCTITECMCGPNYTGKQCDSGVSAIRADLDGGFSKRVCGETTQPARGSYDGSKCVCEPLSVRGLFFAAQNN